MPPSPFSRSDYSQHLNALLTLEPTSTALLTVDMQRDYLDMSVASNPVPPVESERVMKATEKLTTLARRLNIPVVHVYTVRRECEVEAGVDGSPRNRLGRTQGLAQNARVGPRAIPDRLEGSPQSEVPASISLAGDIHIPSKKTMDGFLGTDLDMLLHRVFDRRNLILTGINTDTCVYSTAFSASNRGYRPVVVENCVASTRGPDIHRMALELMSASFAWVLSLDEVEDKLGGNLASS